LNEVFSSGRKKWKEIYNSEEDKKILYNGWERWKTTTGKNINIGDVTTRTFHVIMATWYDETPKNQNSDKSEDDYNFGEGGYLSKRARSRHSLAWQRGALKDDTMGGERKDDSYEEEEEDSVSEEYKAPPLFEVRAVGSSGNNARNTRKRSSMWLIVEGRQGRGGRGTIRNGSI
jgi:hypothetical protein